ncbi:MAG: PAS domain-containing sensor histidine kinase, partial [Cyanobacteria bacterium NC_groundwater_1444_Ag_S-0.65um_54_12]|nr:PAS domain-containing sensor histidine kinase [Cyanobacteria bacterium NC_groundwater_1444_Ag_S-0.65um_54_12]
MTPSLDLRLVASYDFLSKLLRLAVTATAFVMMLGYLFAAVLPETPGKELPISLPVAGGLLLASCSLALAKKTGRLALAGSYSKLLAAFVLFVGIILLISPPDNWLANLAPILTDRQLAPAQFSLLMRANPWDALALISIGWALLLFDTRIRHGAVISDIFALLATAIPYVVLICQLYALVAPDGHVGHYDTIATPVSSAVLMGFAISILLARSEVGLLNFLVRKSPGGILLHQLLPITIIFPPFLGILRLLGERAGLFDTITGLEIMTISLIATASGLLCWHAAMLDKAHIRQKSAEVKLQDQARLLELTHDTVIAYDMNCHVLFWNKGAADRYGWSSQEVLGHHINELVRHPRPMPCGAIRKVLEEKNFWEGELEDMTRDGTSIMVASRLSLEHDEQGKPARILELSNDITAHKRSEEALLASERRFRLLAENARDVIYRYLLLPDRRMEYITPSVETLTGYSQEEFYADPDLPLKLVIEEDLPRFETMLRSISTGSSGQLTLRWRTKDGRVIWTDRHYWPSYEAGKLAAIEGIIRDITEHKSAAEKLAWHLAETKQAKELSHLKDNIISVVSHEIKTPLSLIIGNAELLAEKYPADPLLAGLEDGARRLTEHINAMLDYSALLSDALPLYYSKLDLAEVIKNIEQIVEPDFQNKGLQLQSEVGPIVPLIWGDARRIAQALIELLKNACKFTSPPGKVGIRVVPAGEQVQICVWDTGCGIPAAQYKQLFTAFSRSDVSPVMRAGGLGLGLAIAKGLVELHGGRLTATSREGEGSCFTITLPVEKNELHSPKPPHAELLAEYSNK